MKDLIQYLAQQLVDHPEQVEVTESSSRNLYRYRLKVAEEDVGKIIGKKGRIIQAIRTVVGSAAAKKRVHVRLDILS